jgi:hypothetical protein
MNASLIHWHNLTKLFRANNTEKRQKSKEEEEKKKTPNSLPVNKQTIQLFIDNSN